jgi:hypothetical protein
MPMPNRSAAAAPVADLPPELEARVAALEAAPPGGGFESAGWFWMIILGIAIPMLLLAVGWWA